MRTVLIIETETGKVVASYPVSMHGVNYTPADEEYFKLAWKCAVDDGAVNSDDKGKYSFKLN